MDAWSNAEKRVLVCSGCEGAANTVSVGAGAPLAGGSEAGSIAGGGEGTEMTLQGTGVQTSWIPKSTSPSDLLGCKWDNMSC